LLRETHVKHYFENREEDTTETVSSCLPLDKIKLRTHILGIRRETLPKAVSPSELTKIP